MEPITMMAGKEIGVVLLNKIKNIATMSKEKIIVFKSQIELLNDLSPN